MKGLIMSILLFSGISLQAQFGVSARYNTNNLSSWNDFYEVDLNGNNRAFRKTIDFGANYWFRLKNQRVEFLPEVTYMLKKTETVPPYSFISFAYESSLSQIGVNFNTHIYFMDMNNDCNCPTFSKDGDFLSKSIHLILSPGVVFAANEIILVNDQSSNTTNSTVFKFGAGLGFDIGVNDLITVSPFFTLNYLSSYGSDSYNALIDELCTEQCNLTLIENSSNLQSQLGIRITLRPDYTKGRRF